MAGIIMYHRKRSSSKSHKDGSSSGASGAPSTRYNPSNFANSSVASLNTSKSQYNLQSHTKSQTPSHKKAAMSSLDKQVSCPSAQSTTSSSSSSLPHSFSTSLLVRTNIVNQKYRKQDPETRYDDDGTRYQCVSIPYRINPETNKVCNHSLNINEYAH